AGVHADQVIHGQVGGKDVVGVVQHVVDVLPGGHRVLAVLLPRGVGGADDPVPLPGDDEQYRLLGAQEQAGAAVDAILGDDHVDALGGQDFESFGGPGHCLGVLGPHAGGVDDVPGVDRVVLAGLQVHHFGAGDLPAGIARIVHHLRAGGRIRAEGLGGAHQCHHQAGVVHACVVEPDAAHELIGLDVGEELPHTRAGVVLLYGYRLAAVADHGHGVVQADAQCGVDALDHRCLQ